MMIMMMAMMMIAMMAMMMAMMAVMMPMMVMMMVGKPLMAAAASKIADVDMKAMNMEDIDNKIADVDMTQGSEMFT